MKTLFVLFCAPYVVCAIPFLLVGFVLAITLIPILSEKMEDFAKESK